MYHPDKTQGDTVKTAMFTKIKEAYDTLSDPSKRNEYNNSLEFQKNGISHIFRGNPFDGHGGMFREDMNINPEDLISQLFMNGMFPGMGLGGMGGMGGMGPGIHIKTFHMRPQPIVKKLTIPLHLSYTGGSIPIEIERVVVENGIQINEMETIYVNIEKGIDSDEMIILEGKGHVTQNSKGDVKIIVKIENNKDFERCGLDLKITKKITLKEALTGFQFALKHLNGNTYNINNSKGNVISHNFNKKIPGMGMMRGEYTGDMIITFEVIFPEKLELDVIDKLSELL
jgi:DnaJ-class molecular chaperone